MSDRRWANPAQPQTLQIAVFLLYINGAFALLAVLIGGVGGGGGYALFALALVAGQVGAGYGIANEFKWGYILGIAMALAPFAIRFYFLDSPFAGAGLLTLMFEIALIALLVHPQSRDYQRIWFK